MTHATVTTEDENAGSTDAVYHAINITSLDSAGAESYDPQAETGVSGADRYGVSVRGQESSAYLITWDHVAGELSVVDAADGTDVAQGTDVGEVILELIGT